MAVAELVLVDTCIWVPFFNRPQCREKRALDELLHDGEPFFTTLPSLPNALDYPLRVTSNHQQNDLGVCVPVS